MKTFRKEVRNILKAARSRWPKKGWVSSGTLFAHEIELNPKANKNNRKYSTMLRFARQLAQHGETEKRYVKNKKGRITVMYRAKK